MENATKALLIAAGVLIVIVIVALGVKILGGAGDTGKSAEQVGKEISSATEQASYNLKLQNYKLILSNPEMRKPKLTGGSYRYEYTDMLEFPEFEYDKKYLISIGSVTDAINTNTNKKFDEFTLTLVVQDPRTDENGHHWGTGAVFKNTLIQWTRKANCDKLQYVEIFIPAKDDWWRIEKGKKVYFNTSPYLYLALYYGEAGETGYKLADFNDIKIYKEK